MRQRYLPSSFSASAGYSVYSLCIRRTFCKLTWTLHVAEVPSFNFAYSHRTFRKLPSSFVRSWDLPLTFRGTVGPSVTFSQLSVWSRVFPSAFVTFLCVCETLRQLSVHPRELLSTFRDCAGPLVAFCQLCIRGTFRQFSVLPQDLSSAFCTAAGLSVKFRQLSVRLWDLLSTSVNFPCAFSSPSNFCAPAGSFLNILHGYRTFHQHQSTFRASVGLTANLRQLFVRPGYILSTFCLAGWPSVNFHCIHGTCQLHSNSLYYTVVQAVQQSSLPRTHKIFSYDCCYFH